MDPHQMNATPPYPATYRISERPVEYVEGRTWVWANDHLKWCLATLGRLSDLCEHDTYWCHKDTRPTHDPRRDSLQCTLSSVSVPPTAPDPKEPPCPNERVKLLNACTEYRDKLTASELHAEALARALKEAVIWVRGEYADNNWRVDILKAALEAHRARGAAGGKK